MRLLILVLALISGIAAFSQVQQTHRYEKTVKFSDEDFTLIPLKEDGIAMIRGTNNYKSGNRGWELITLDTVLHERWVMEFEIDSQCKLIGSDRSPGLVHILFIKNEVSGEMRLVTVNLDTREVKKYEIKPELNYKLTHFNVIGKNFIFGGVLTMEPCVLLFYPHNENLRVMPGFFQKNTELIDVRVNQNQTFNTLVLDKGSPDERKIFFKTFDSDGKQLLEDVTGIGSEINIQSGISSTLERDDLMVFGTWGRKNSMQSTAFYALPVNPFSGEKIKTLYFGQLDHYLDYLKPKKAAAIKAKTKESIEQDDIPTFSNYVTPQKILELPNGFLMLAESHLSQSGTSQSGYPYSPNSPYASNTSPYYSPYGPYYYPPRRYSPTSYGNNMVNQAEIRKVESIAICVDASGKVLWDFSMKFDDLKVETSGQVSDVWMVGDTVRMMYRKESVLKIKSISIATQEAKETSQKIKLMDPYAEVKSEDKQTGFVEHWTGNTFFVWGYESIRSYAKGADRNRDVFYVNKITIH